MRKLVLFLGLLGVTCAPAMADAWFPASMIQTAEINTASAATFLIATPANGTSIYVLGGVIMGGGTTTLQIEEGTGSLCGTNTVVLSGPINLAADAGFLLSSEEFVTKPGYSLCGVNADAVQVSGSVTYVSI